MAQCWYPNGVTIVLRVPPPPRGEHLLQIPALGNALVQGLREGDRAEALSLLVDRILPVYLQGLSDHPNPRQLARLAYEGMSKTIEGASVDGRLTVIRAAGQHAELRDHVMTSLQLAIARYLKDHPDLVAQASAWVDPTIEHWAARPVSEIAGEATRRLDRLEAWRERTRAQYPDVWETDRTEYLEAKLALQSARSGSFDTAMGSLREFLRSVGAQPMALNIR
jgi:hypothetical protein